MLYGFGIKSFRVFDGTDHFAVVPFFELANDSAHLYFSMHIKHRVFRSVVLFSKSYCIGSSVRAQTFGIPQNVATKRSVTIDQLFKLIEN